MSFPPRTVKEGAKEAAASFRSLGSGTKLRSLSQKPRGPRSPHPTRASAGHGTEGSPAGQVRSLRAVWPLGWECPAPHRRGTLDLTPALGSAPGLHMGLGGVQTGRCRRPHYHSL